MSKKRKQNSSSRWTPFQSVLPYRNGKPMELKEHETYWQNSFYTVNKMLLEAKEDGAIHLSIRKNDRKAARDWRHFQRIKNELAGPEREAIEVFPPESQLVDTANQYHMFVYPEGLHSPFTWEQGRHVSDDTNPEQTAEWLMKYGVSEEEAHEIVETSKQRPLEEEEE